MRSGNSSHRFRGFHPGYNAPHGCSFVGCMALYPFTDGDTRVDENSVIRPTQRHGCNTDDTSNCE
jgi:hypothetical protein